MGEYNESETTREVTGAGLTIWEWAISSSTIIKLMLSLWEYITLTALCNLYAINGNNSYLYKYHLCNIQTRYKR